MKNSRRVKLAARVLLMLFLAAPVVCLSNPAAAQRLSQADLNKSQKKYMKQKRKEEKQMEKAQKKAAKAWKKRNRSGH